MDGRFLQANKEARWSLGLALAYLLVWALSAWLGGTQSGISGLPRWFEHICTAIVYRTLCADGPRHFP